MSESPVMYFVVNSDLKMSPGKIAGQVGHAAIAAYESSSKNNLFREWSHSGSAKVVLKAPQNIIDELRGKYKCFPIHDAGRTQIEANSLTVIAFPICRKGDIPELTALKLL